MIGEMFMLFGVIMVGIGLKSILEDNKDWIRTQLNRILGK